MTFKKYIPAVFTVALSIPVYADEMNAGTVHFTGEIIEPSCVIDGNDGTDNNVPLGTYPTTLFANPGDESSLVPFTIELKDCPLQTDGLTSIQLTFEGTTVASSNADLLAVSALTTAGNTAATNIGVAVSTFNRTDTLLKMDGSEGQVALDLPTVDGNAIRQQFVARYRAFATPVTAGPADADMTVNILYR
ncbi:fimbrial protein [Trabulsiella odontotermitis]|uniref:fimbrial protein n=1 Tax=Trabulsiella odontotermitis TaxID=379893 RepID=UPI000675F4F4|nr:fimbrial protein [Trabulsiella odontotermitis]KNC89487.1 fimbrial protein [Trabulsiella odontotermitis]